MKNFINNGIIYLSFNNLNPVPIIFVNNPVPIIFAFCIIIFVIVKIKAGKYNINGVTTNFVTPGIKEKKEG